MRSARSLRPSPAMLVALTALVFALSGAAVAATKIGTSDIKSKAVTTSKIDKKAVTGNRIASDAVKSGKIKDEGVKRDNIAADAINGSKVEDDSLSDAEISDYKVAGDSFVQVTATEGANEAAARAAAPETVLFEKGQLTVYAKCFRSIAVDTTFGEVYSRTTADGAIQEGDDDLPGGNAATDFLNTNTLETDRQLDNATATGNDANYDETEYTLASPDGTGVQGELAVAAKNGNLAGGNGIYGAGNVCLFQGTFLG